MKYAHAAHTRRRTIIYMAAAFLFLVVLSAVIIWNGAKLLRALERSTLSYLEDVAGFQTVWRGWSRKYGGIS